MQSKQTRSSLNYEQPGQLVDPWHGLDTVRLQQLEDLQVLRWNRHPRTLVKTVIDRNREDQCRSRDQRLLGLSGVGEIEQESRLVHE